MSKINEVIEQLNNCIAREKETKRQYIENLQRKQQEKIQGQARCCQGYLPFPSRTPNVEATKPCIEQQNRLILLLKR